MVVFLISATQITAKEKNDSYIPPEKALIESTFLISNIDNEPAGTGFILVNPLDDNQSKYQYIFFTAAHVLKNIDSDYIYVNFRTKRNDTYDTFKRKIRIKKNGKPLWTSHKEVDLAAFKIAVPRDVNLTLIPTRYLAKEKFWSNNIISPGSKIITFGYPFGQSGNPGKFPIAREGIVSSFPLKPTKGNQTFLVDMEVFEGNSGGPVFYLSSGLRRVKEGYSIGGPKFKILGLMTQSTKFQKKSIRKGLLKQKIPLRIPVTQTHYLSLGTVIHSTAFRDLLNKL